MVKIALASDHGGYYLKSYLKDRLFNYMLVDFGTYSDKSVDYPDYIKKAAISVSKNECEIGIAICYSGIGASIVANKFKNIRAALCLNLDMARSSKEHNNANILVLGSKFVSPEYAFKIFETWIYSDFHFGRHKNRIEKIDKIENTIS